MAKAVKTSGGGFSFGQVAETPKKKGATKDKENIRIAEPTIADAVTRFIERKAKIDQLTAEQDEDKSIIKEYTKGLEIKYMEDHGVRKESYIISTATDGVLAITEDKYITSTLDQERIAYLKATYGEDVITADTKFIFDGKLLTKYQKEIEAAINGCKNIPAADKAKIVYSETKYGITKGLINRFRDIAKKAKTSVAAVWADFQPIQQLKARGEE